MNNLKEKLQERWQDKRKKSSNWTSLLIKVIILIVIIIAIARISTNSSLDWSKFKTKTDTLQTVSDSLKGQ
jgi:hypothetical protein